MLVSVAQRQSLTVGVFQNASAAQINGGVAEVGLDVVQLHGHEPASVMTVLHVSADGCEDETAVTALRASAHPFDLQACALVLDISTRTGAGAGASGGTGREFEWSVAERLGCAVVVAGRLSPESIGAANVRGCGCE